MVLEQKYSPLILPSFCRGMCVLSTGRLEIASALIKGYRLIRGFSVPSFSVSHWLRIVWFDSVTPVRVKHTYTQVQSIIMSMVGKMALVEMMDGLTVSKRGDWT
jgi:hypothetical protein